LKPQRNLTPQTLGKTQFDFATLLVGLSKAVIHVSRSIGHIGLGAAMRRRSGSSLSLAPKAAVAKT
jgi:hypothetical protein